jgi:cellulose synthase/poly-beta-1,6-N-acetylglucosamine synthase-like glycosyltransferase
MWRQEAGGWQSDTLTEDLDLSDRVQRRGWLIGYGPDGVVPAELPAALEALEHQQFRWARGGLQTARKVLPPLFETDIPWQARVFAAIHLLG